MNLLLIINNPFIGETKMETENNKIIKIEGDAVRSMNQTTFGEFYSKHSKEDIEEWIQSKGGHGLDMDEIFNDGVACLEWEDVDYVMDTLDVSYEEHSGEVPDKFIHDEEIQQFIDEKPKREREIQIKTLTRQSERLSNEFEELKKGVREIFNPFTKLFGTEGVFSGNYENLPEDEKKIYLNLKELFAIKFQETSQ